VSAEFVFALSVAAKMAITALFVVGVTSTAERAGPVVGGLVSTLPVSSGPAYIFLAFDHDLAFLSQSALGGLVNTAAIALFALAYVTVAHRFRTAISAVLALTAWLVGAVLLLAITWTTASAVVLNIGVIAVGSAIVRRYRKVARPISIRRWYDIPLRAALVAVLVAIVVVASMSVGPTLTGTIAAFPIIFLSLILILQPRLGGPATAAGFANSMIGLFGFGMFCLVLHAAVVPLGIGVALTLAIATNAGMNAMSWLIQR
jgi:hypothetical protein